MKLKKSILLLLILTLALGTALAACGGGEETTTEPEQPAETDTNTDTDTDAAGEPTQGGTVTFGMYSAPAGVFNPVLYGDAYESNVIDPLIFETLVALDDTLSWEPKLAKDWSFENDNKTLVLNLRDDVLWHDGEKFTAEDVKFTYEVIGHPDYTGVRQIYVAQLVGKDEYLNGEADEISGIEIVDDYTIKFHFVEPNLLALRDASFMIIPKHVYENVPVATMKEAPESLDFDKLIGTGPFKASQWLSGEFYQLDRNENYWDGAPYLDSLVWKVVNQDVAPSLLASGEIDIITRPGGVSPTDFEYVSGLPGVTVYETPAFAYQYMGFKLHHRTKEDVDGSVINPDNWIPNEKLHSVELRQAIAYAIDRQGLVDGLLEGHGTVMNAPFPPVSWAFDESAVNDYPFSPEKAKELLEAGGFKDVDGDGFVEQPNGEPLVIRLDYPTGNKVRELSAPIIQEQLQAVGIKIDLRTPREAGAHFDAMEKDTQDEGMDMFLAGWSLATADPDPKGIWDITVGYNYPRWNDQKSQDLLNAAVKAPEAFDQAYRQGLYNEWAGYISEQLPVVFLYSQNDIFAYNNRIQNIQHGPTNIIDDTHKWYIAE